MSSAKTLIPLTEQEQSILYAALSERFTRMGKLHREMHTTHPTIAAHALDAARDAILLRRKFTNKGKDND